MNQDQMMAVNGGGYYVPVYQAQYSGGRITGFKFLRTEWVASGSGIGAIYYF